jgi:hypothetical protein
MPKGSSKPQAIASKKYQNKAGYMAKSFKLKRDCVERFKEACDKVGGRSLRGSSRKDTI